MSDRLHQEESFIEEAEALVLDHLSDEQFGVSELAHAMNMSRSNLLRKIKKITKLSASQFIRQIRLKKGMELLRQTSMTVSEISHEVGFGSSSYFIKCFREYYGYPPGEHGKNEKKPEDESTLNPAPKRPKYWSIAGALSVLILLLIYFIIAKRPQSTDASLEKSLAVLPFKNDSSDSSNIYFVNGLMESALNNLQKIEDLRVVSRTSVEKYRYQDRSIPEISDELNVNYIVEGSGQRVGNQILLNIQLIEAATDKHIWAEQYNRELGDIFALQNEIAKSIAEAVEAIITPEELIQLDKRPTENIQAYEYYLKALEPFYARSTEGLEKAIPLFEKALEHDPQFSQAYANLAISYYHFDIYKRQKLHTERINNYADKALLYDSKSALSLIAKALYYMQIDDYKLALPHLEKALEYNPNSAPVVQMLADIYARYIPNTSKYLEYALKGIQLDIAANDSISKSYIYLHLSNALIQTGFVNESMTYVNKSLDYYPLNEFAPLLKAFVTYAQNRDLQQTRASLKTEWEKDTTRLDILQEVAKLYFFENDYENAFHYYEIFVNARERRGLDIYAHEDLKIAAVYEKMGLNDQAAVFYDSYNQYCEQDQSIYKSASLAVKHAYEGDLDKAIAQLKEFALQDNYQYWILLFMEEDPLLSPLKSHPEFDETIQRMKDRFWKNQTRLKQTLEVKGLI